MAAVTAAGPIRRWRASTAGWMRPSASGGAMRHDLERAEIQDAGMSSDDEGLSSDGERGGEEYYDESFDGIGAEAAMGDGEFGGGPWSGEDPYAYGGAD